MRLFNHDYAGHPFQCDLSRALADRGHTVWHAYSDSNPSPRGVLEKKAGDADALEFLPLRLDKPFQKQSYWRRRRQELEYAQLLIDEIERCRPDVVLSGNTPTEAQRLLLRACHASGRRFVTWVQDIYGLAVHRLLRKRMSLVGDLIGRWYIHLDRTVLRHSDAVVIVSDDFLPFVESSGARMDRVRTIENWASLENVPLLPKENAWAREQGVQDKCCLLYSGTLGMKHNPGLLLELAQSFEDNDTVQVVVISEGAGADWLRTKAAEENVKNLTVSGWVPPDMLPLVLAGSDVLLGILDADAGVFSVPSKVLTYLCANRPVVLAVPLENLAARIVDREGAGLVVRPDDAAGFAEAVRTLVDNPAQRVEMGKRGRAYAEKTFDVQRIADRFEEVFRIAGCQI